MLQQLDTAIGFAVVMSVVSLLITIVTQTASAALGLRGKNLSDALETLIRKCYPAVNNDDKALGKKMADYILTHSSISDSLFADWAQWFSSGWRQNLAQKTPLPLRSFFGWIFKQWRRASAIRPDEFLEILRDMESGSTFSASPPAMSSPPTGTSTKMQEAAAEVLSFLKIETPETAEAVNAFRTALPELAKTQGRAVIAQFNTAADTALTNLEGRFNAAQDRAKQWFAMHMRLVTILCAVIAAFVLQLDSFQLIQRISSDKDVRDRLVATAPALAKQAQEVFDAASPLSLQTHNQAILRMTNQYPLMAKVVLTTNDLGSVQERDEKVRAQLANLFGANAGEVFTNYTNAIREAAAGDLKDWTQRFGAISGQLSDTGINLVPDPYPKGAAWFGWRRHFFGMLASAALLGLGAPFWFNLLKTLTSLRPALAGQVDKNPHSGITATNAS